jgi:hypothetical protein
MRAHKGKQRVRREAHVSALLSAADTIAEFSPDADDWDTIHALEVEAWRFNPRAFARINIRALPTRVWINQLG